MFRACDFAALFTEFPFQRNLSCARYFLVRMKICAARGRQIGSEAILVGSGLGSGLALRAIFLEGDKMFGVLARRLRAFDRASKRFERFLCGLRCLLFFEFFFFRFCQGVFGFRDLAYFFEDLGNDFFCFDVIFGSLGRFFCLEDFKEEEDLFLFLFHGESGFFFGCSVNCAYFHDRLLITVDPFRDCGRRDGSGRVASGRPNALFAFRVYFEQFFGFRGLYFGVGYFSLETGMARVFWVGDVFA